MKMSLKGSYLCHQLCLPPFMYFLRFHQHADTGAQTSTPNTALISVSKWQKPERNLRRKLRYNFKFQFTEFPRMIPGIELGEVLGIRNEPLPPFLVRFQDIRNKTHKILLFSVMIQLRRIAREHLIHPLPVTNPTEGGVSYSSKSLEGHFTMPPGHLFQNKRTVIKIFLILKHQFFFSSLYLFV